MIPTRRRSLAAGLALAAALAAPAAAEEAAPVARARLALPGSEEAAATVFFLAVEPEPGAVAVGSAHAFERRALAEAGALEIEAGPEGEAVARSKRFYAPPGTPFPEPEATLRDDYAIFALDRAPRGVRLLEPASGLPPEGARVRIVGVPASGTPEPAALGGRVLRSAEARIEVALEGRPELRGLGGAPVLLAEGEEAGRVVGLLQSARPDEEGLRAGVGPIAGVRAALAEPYEGGLGRLFATLAPLPSAATSHGQRRRTITGSAFGRTSAEESAARVEAAAARLERARALPLAPAEGALRVELWHPSEGAVLGEADRAFVAGHARAVRERTRHFDLVIVLDTSASTQQPSGADVDGDGRVGRAVGTDPQGRPLPGSTDPGDSILAAEVEAARALLRGLSPRYTRAALVTFAGEREAPPPGTANPARVLRAARTEEPLTTDFDRIERALGRVAERPPRGGTHMAAGVDQAVVELLGLRGALSRPRPGSEKVVLFLTDGRPTLPEPGDTAGNVRAVLRAAERAQQAGARIHAFAIGPEALGGPLAAVEMAALTEGRFTPVRDPAHLVPLVERVRFAGVEELSLRNATTGAAAAPLRLHADGSFDGLVPLETGKNRVEARARSRGGAEATAAITVHYAPGEANPFLPAELVPKRTALLERRLVEIRHERAERVRRELLLEMERERAAAKERAARQRKELELEAERPEEEAEGGGS